jgi:outer membrane immunogenic protein
LQLDSNKEKSMRFMKIGTLAAISVIVSAAAAHAGDTQQNWSGFYVGGNFGGDWSRSDEGTALQPHFPSASEPGAALSHEDSGPHGGIQGGHNWQIPNSPVVPGIEGDQSR